MAKKKYPILTCLESACSGSQTGHIFLVGITHQLPDPTEDLSSTVFDLQLSSGGLEWDSVCQGADHFNYPSWFNCVGKDPNGTLFIGEDNGFIRCQGGKSTVFDLKALANISGSFQCVYVRGLDDVVFGGDHGDVVHVQGNHIVAHKIGKSRFDQITASLERIHGIGPDFIIVVGNNGAVGRFQGDKWERVRPPCHAKLQAVWCRSETEIYIGGGEGHAWRWDGGDQWDKLEVPSTPEGDHGDVTDFAEYQGQVYAALGRQGIGRLEGNSFLPVPKVGKEHVGRLSSTNLGLVGLGGVWGEEGGWFTLYDGERWRAKPIKLKRLP